MKLNRFCAIAFALAPLLAWGQISQSQWEIEMESHILRNAKMAQFLLRDPQFLRSFPEYQVLASDSNRAVRVLLEHDASKVIKNESFVEYFKSQHGIDVLDLQKQAANNYGKNLKPGDGFVQKLNIVDSTHMDAAATFEKMAKPEKAAVLKLEALVDKTDRYFEAYRKASLKDPIKYPPADSPRYPQKKLPEVYSEEFARMNKTGSEYSKDFAQKFLKLGKVSEAKEALRMAKALEFIEKNYNPIEITKGLDPVSYKSVRPTFEMKANTSAFERMKFNVAEKYIPNSLVPDAVTAAVVRPNISIASNVGSRAVAISSKMAKAAGGAVGVSGLITGGQYLFDPENTNLETFVTTLSGSSSTGNCATLTCANFFQRCAQEVLKKQVSQYQIMDSTHDYGQCVNFFFGLPLQEQSKLRSDGDLNRILLPIAPKVMSLSCQAASTSLGSMISARIESRDGVIFDQKMSYAPNDSLIRVQRLDGEKDQIFYVASASGPTPDILQHCAGGAADCKSIPMKKVVDKNLYFWSRNHALLQWAKESDRVAQTQSHAIVECCHSHQCSSFFEEEELRLKSLSQQIQLLNANKAAR